MNFRYFVPKRWLLSLLVLLSITTGARAVVIQVGNGSGNTSAPDDDPGFPNVGVLSGGSMIYLKNGWVLTAHHVVSTAGALPGTVTFAGESYATDSGSYQRLTNNAHPSASEFTDLVMFRLTSNPDLPDLQISSTIQQAGTSVLMVGAGRNREADLTKWDAEWTITEDEDADREGYRTNLNRSVRWGENEISDSGVFINNGTGENPRDIASFGMTFGEAAGTNEAQVVTGDSGGAVFAKNSLGEWELVGLMHSAETFNGQPGNTAVFGNKTWAADLSFYADQINAIAVPEPSGLCLLGLGTLLLAFRRCRG